MTLGSDMVVPGPAEFTFFFPDCSDGREVNAKLKLGFGIDFEEAMMMIYDRMGASKVKRKPRFGYKFSGVRTKNPINLESEEEWQDMKESYEALFRNPKRTLPIEIELFPQQNVSNLIFSQDYNS